MPTPLRPIRLLALALTLFAAATAGAEAVAVRGDVLPLAQVDRLVLEPVDVAAARAQDTDLRRAGEPDRFAIPEDVWVTPATHGTWQDLPDEGLALWRLRIAAPGCLSLNLGCERFALPSGGRLEMRPLDGRGPARVFTARDMRPHGQLWTPVVLGDEVVVELTVPLRAKDDVDLVISRVGKGYRGFGEVPAKDEGGCSIDVVCPESAGWEDEIDAVGVYTMNGQWKCTGTLMNNTAEDGTPLFLTGLHCGIDESLQHTVVVYWNFESPVCGQRGGGSLDDFQTGCQVRARWGGTDMCLVELDEQPNPIFGVSYAGWSRADLAPSSAVAIHHPSTDEKSISFEHDPLQITSYYGTTSPGDGNYLRVVDWDLATTEEGSSGSAIFDPDHRVVGHLHGGLASCTNDESDWYGRLAAGWEGGGEPQLRLKDWLDPGDTGAIVVDTWAPGARGLRVSGAADLDSQGEAGGPFSPVSVVYTLRNQSTASLDYGVTVDQPWATVVDGSGTLAGLGTADVTVDIAPAADALAPGFYTATVSFTNLTDGAGDTTRPVALQVGTIETHHAWTMDTDPGWARDGLWAWGAPTGGGGSDPQGNPDPAAGFTGANVMGYNLAGNYEPDLPERVVTTGAIDCSHLQAVSLHYRRWLGVETSVYDHAALRASVDSTVWTDVWTNGTTMNGGTWEAVEHDLSGLADGQPTLYLRWVMGTTDEAWNYCGWNLDDVEIRGLHDGTVGIEDDPDDDGPPPVAPAELAVRSWPNPFNPQTTIACDVPRPQHVTVVVHDARGRRVRVLHDGEAAAGTVNVVWNGTDDRGLRVSSGVYFVQVLGEFQRVTHKISLLK
jgi:hypothetical protein